MPDSERVPTTDGASVVLHDLGGVGPPLLLCHPTGFHGRVWEPVAAELAPVARSWALDFRGHGDATLPANGDMAWRGMADDVLAVVDRLGPSEVVAAGHSMGGAALVLAEQRRPGTFARLWLYEPILVPARLARAIGTNPMAEAARSRRSRFPDRDAAYDNYAGKPPLDVLAPAALRAYVDHGFRAAGEGPGVELKCRPEIEARTFGTGGSSDAVEQLGAVRCPTVVAVGGDGRPPARFAAEAEGALPHGRLERHPDLGHFGPMEDPAAMAAAISASLIGGRGSPSGVIAPA